MVSNTSCHTDTQGHCEKGKYNAYHMKNIACYQGLKVKEYLSKKKKKKEVKEYELQIYALTCMIL